MLGVELLFVLSLSLSFGVSLFVAYKIERQKDVPGRRSFQLIMLAAGWWSFFYALEILSPGIQLKIWALQLEYIAIMFLPELWILFAMQYTRRLSRVRAYWYWLVFFPASMILAVWTNSWHGLVWTEIRIEGQDIQDLSYSYGPMFWLYVGYAYTLIGLGSALLLGRLLRAKSVYKRQAGAIILLAFLPLSASLYSIFDLGPYSYLDLTPVFFSVSGIVALWGIVRYHFLEIVPIARYAVFENLRDGILVLDMDRRIVDANPMAYFLSGCHEEEVLGKYFYETAFSTKAISQKLASAGHVQDEVHFNKENTVVSCEVRVQSLYDPQEDFLGSMVIVEDISQRKKTDESLIDSFKYIGAMNRKLSLLKNLEQLVHYNEKNYKETLTFILQIGKQLSNAQAVYFYRGLGEKVFELESYLSPIPSNKIKDIQRLDGKLLSLLRVLFRKQQRMIVGRHQYDWSKFWLGDGQLEIVFLPLVFRNSILGVIVLAGADPEHISRQYSSFYDMYEMQAVSILFADNYEEAVA